MKSVIMLTDCLDMTIDVDWHVKPQNNNNNCCQRHRRSQHGLFIYIKLFMILLIIRFIISLNKLFTFVDCIVHFFHLAGRVAPHNTNGRQWIVNGSLALF